MRKTKRTDIQNKILCAVLLTLVTASAGAQTAPKRPQMVVGIMVEGLNQDYLELLQNYFTADGFKRLMRDGATLSNVDYGPGVDGAAATAIIYTGAAPTVNGIPAEFVYDRERRRSRNILLDTAKIGNFTNETYSPAAIIVSTLGDEVRLDAAGTGWVYSVSPDPVQSIVMTGHAGNSGFWLSDLTGAWATTTHYKDVPRSISSRNYRRPISTVLDTLKWEPLLPAAIYPDIPDYKKQYPFRHYFSRKDTDRYRQYKSSAKVNEEVTAVAEEYLSTMALGTRGPVDMLNIGYTLSPYPYTADGDNRMETVDSYLRLDRDLARLMKAIDKRTGAGNSLIFLAGYPARPTSRRDDEKWGIPSGEFSPRKAISLLNMYLIALHGNGDWVTGYFNRNFYLNQRLIKENRLDASEVRAEAAEFLARMSGVSGVHTIDDIIASRAGDNASALKRNTVVKYAGDVIVNITPGWSVTDDTVSGAANTPAVARDAFFPSTVIIMGPGVEPLTIEEKIDARRIAPTVSRLLRIRSPGAASLPAIRL